MNLIYSSIFIITSLPQLLKNFKEPEINGFSVDHVFITTIGNLSYFVYIFYRYRYWSDFLFSSYGVLISIIYLIQLHYKSFNNITIRSIILIFYFCISFFMNPELLGWIKVCISIVRYIPQLFLNYKLKTTHAISNVSIGLAMLGGSLSMFDEFYNQRPMRKQKLFLSILTLLNNTIILIQYFIF
jgi:uncharacterized protein with PQ loop repeat